jgi:diketogulonate reductase-like aldo/keto reductase
VTKVHPRDFAENKLKSAVRRSKSLLYGNNTKVLDVVLLHSPNCWPNSCTKEEEKHSWKEGWFALQELKKSGEISAIGVSNFDVGLLRELLDLADVKVSVIQNWMDPFRQDEEVRQLAASHGIVYMSYSSYGGQWEWKLKSNPVFSSSELLSVAKKHETSVAQVVTSWVLQSDCVAIPRSSNLDHLMDNFVTKTFLDEDDMTTIKSLDGSIGSLWEE